MRTALVVDDGLAHRRLVGRLLQMRAGLRVLYATNGAEALAAMEQERPDVVITDLQMPVMNGMQLVEKVVRRHPSVPIILVTARWDAALAQEALRDSAAGCLPKQGLVKGLVAAVTKALGKAAPVLTVG